MKKINLEYDKAREKSFLRKMASTEDAEIVIDSSCIITIEEQVSLVVIHGVDLDEVESAVKGIKQFYAGSRGSGLVNEARIFGFSPRMPTRNHHDYCSVSKMGEEFPAAHAKLLRSAKIATELFKKYSPEKYKMQRAWLDKFVLPAWSMPDSAFTSGVVNRTSQLKYHYDRGNIKNGWSCMFVIKEGISGGDLSLPGLNAIVRLPHRSALLFDGQSLLHGVTPMKREKISAERYSVVYYTLDAMKQCLAPKDEIIRAQRVRDEREKKWLTTRKKNQ